MNKINILDSSVFNKIAAGEVVERPSSVVKELLDNSIDAGATRIVVRIVNGGIDKISVSDNGSGIEPDDFERVFLAHATSKIKTAEDLERIGTLGFRGEALASIAAVSEVVLTSKTEANTFGYRLQIKGGVQEEKTEIGCSNGTTVEVEHLFYNVPARAKFLKKPRQEQTEITNLISRYILANPTVSITYFADDEEIFHSGGRDLKEALFVVYGKEILENLIAVDYVSAAQIKVSGWIGKPTYTKPNRTYQTLIVNSRYVVNSMVSLCVFNAYERYLMKGQFPFYVLRLDIPLDKLDVNVHPNKMDIRFENGNEIYGVVYNAINQALSEASTQVNSVQLGEFERVGSGFSYSDQKQEQKTVEIGGKVVIPQPVPEPQARTETKFYDSLFAKTVSFQQNANPFMAKSSEQAGVVVPAQETVPEQQTMFAKRAIKFIGTIFQTYLVVESNEHCYFIDQHAAHERLLFDKLKREIDQKQVSSQLLIIPFMLNTNHLEKEFLDSHLSIIQSLGFQIEPFGNLSYKISSIPLTLRGINLDYFFSLILGELSILKAFKQSDLILEKLMQHACKSAVKAGYNLTERDVDDLLTQMESEKMELQCPHGRPVVVEVSQKEMEKWFKRVV